MASLLNIPIQDFVILCLFLLLFIFGLSIAAPDVYEAFRIFLISATIGFVVGRLIAPYFLGDMDPVLIDYFSFALAGGVTLVCRAYFSKKHKSTVRYK